MNSSRSRRAGGIRAGSFAVVMNSTSDRSNASSTNASRKRWCCAGSSTSSRTAAGSGAELVDLVEHEDRVLAAHAPQLAQDGAGLRSLPGAVVAAQVRLVTQPAAGQLHEPAPEGLGDTLGQRSLADPGRPAETKHGAGTAPVPAAYGQVLDDARLGVVEAGVAGIERRAGLARQGPGRDHLSCLPPRPEAMPSP